MPSCINEVDTVLQMFGALSQAEQTMQPSMATATMEAAAAILVDYRGAGSKGATELSKLCENKKLLNLEVDLNAGEEELRNIANAWNAWMGASTSNITSNVTSNKPDPFTWMKETIKGNSKPPPPIPPIISGEVAST
jgi:hypothetical protein